MIDVVVIDVMLIRFECKVKNIVVVIGSLIGLCCFEVGDDVVEKFIIVFGNSVVVRREGEFRFFVDLCFFIRF